AVSPVDVSHLETLVSSRGVASSAASVVSRVFAFDLAPRNTLSFLLAAVQREERHFGVTDLLTYVNPNMGFTGTSYYAANWALAAEAPHKYYYLDDRYITLRELA